MLSPQLCYNNKVMPTTNPRNKNTSVGVIFAVIFHSVFIVASSTFLTLKTQASDPCKNISDVDDQAKCYEDQIEKKQDEYQSTSSKLEDIRKTKDDITKQINDLLGQLSVTQAQIDNLQKQINDVKSQLEEINAKLNDSKDALNQKISVRNHILRTYSKRNMLNDLETLLLTTSNNLSGFQFAEFSQAFNKSLADETIKIIGGLNSDIDTYEKDRAEAESLKGDLEDTQTKFVAAKASLDSKKANAQGDLTETTKQESTFENKLTNLSKEISDLSEKQQSILKAKYGDEYGSVGDYESPSASTPNPPSSLGKPVFAAFSYGAYTHYNGMSQYGAKGRADSGQKYKDILKFYYKVSTEKKDGFPSKINVQGYGEIDFQYYLYGIAEMPTDWPIEALKAQAIAARTYAYKSSKPICTTQSCQVFNKSKADKVKSGQYSNWKKAVDDTKGEILKNSSTSQYSSTTGGYINNVGWDTSGSWPDKAYEKKAGSPWFYKAWYTKSYSDSATCGRSYPWLSAKEMADILNALIVWENGSSSEKGHISPVTTGCWGGDPYSVDEMKEKADKYKDGYSKVTSIDADISNGGYTSKVTLQTDKGSVSVDGDVFKTVFNLRAPSYVAIRSRLYDFDKKN